MQLFLENETEITFDFDTEEIAKCVIEKVLEVEGCPFETEVQIGHLKQKADHPWVICLLNLCWRTDFPTNMPGCTTTYIRSVPYIFRDFKRNLLKRR